MQSLPIGLGVTAIFNVAIDLAVTFAKQRQFLHFCVRLRTDTTSHPPNNQDSPVALDRPTTVLF